MQQTQRFKRLMVLSLASLMVIALGLLGYTSFGPVKALSTTLTTDGAYAWVYDAGKDALRSGNSEIRNSSSTMKLYINEAGTFRVSYLISSEEGYDEATIVHTPDGGEAVTYGPYSGTVQTEFAELALEVAEGDTITFTYQKDASNDNGDDCFFVKLPDITGTVSVSVSSADPEKGSVTLNGGTETSGEFELGSALEIEAVPAEGMVFAYWSSNGEIYSKNPVISTSAYFTMDLQAVFVPESYLDISSEDGTYSLDSTGKWRDNLGGNVGLATMKVSFVGTRYFWFNYMVTKTQTAQQYGEFTVTVDGERIHFEHFGLAFTKTMMVKVEGEGYHEAVLTFDIKNEGGNGSSWVETKVWTEEEAPRVEIQFNYDERLGDVYMDSQRVASGSVLSVLKDFEHTYQAVPKESVVSSFDSSKMTDVTFVEFRSVDGMIYSDNEDYTVAFWADFEINVVFEETALLSDEMRMTLTQNGQETEYELENGGVYEILYQSEHTLMFYFRDYAAVSEQLVVLDNGNPVSELFVENGYFRFGLANIDRIHRIECYTTAEGYQDSASISFTIMLYTGNTMEEDLVMAGSEEVIIESPTELVNGSGTPVANLFAWHFDPANSEGGALAYQSGCTGVNNGFSLITFTVTGSGAFVMEILVDSESGYDFALYDTQPIYGRDDAGPNVKKISGSQAWTQITLAIEAGEGVQTTVYLAYGKDGSSASGQDLVSVRNVGFFSGSEAIYFGTSRESYGSVTAKVGDQDLVSGGAVAGGQHVTLTAVIPEGGQFYGWKNSDGELISSELILTFTAAGEQTYTALIEEKNHYAALIGSEFYTTLTEALTDAVSGQTVVLLRDEVITSALTIPSGITLLVPYSGANRATEIGTTKTAINRVSWYNEASVAKYLYRTLTVNAGVTLTVDGSLVIGAVCHYPDQSSQGHTSGAYARLINDGQIFLNGNGSFYSYGLTEGVGSIRAKSGADVYQPFMVNNYAGGSNTYDLYYAEQFPFVQYATVNIQCELVIESGAREIGVASLYFWSSITTQNVLVVGFEGNEDLSYGPGLIVLKEGAVLTKTYDGTRYVESSVSSANNNSDSGKSTVTITGGASAGIFDLQGFGSEEMVLSLPYTFDLILNDGVYDINYAYKIMPGASVTVGEDAVLNVNAGGSLAVYDGLRQSDMSGKRYPTTEELVQYGFSPAGTLFVNGTLNVEGRFAGIVQTTSVKAELNFGADAVLSLEITDGAKGAYDSNVSLFTLTARALFSTGSAVELTALQAGKTYMTASASLGGKLTSYTMQYLINCTADDPDADPDYFNDPNHHKWSNETVSVDVALTGLFVEAHEHTYELDEVTKAPTATEDGQAVLACTHPGCLEKQTVTIPAYGTPTAEYTEGLKLSDISLPEGWSWKNGNISLFAGETEGTAVWNGMYEVRLTVTVAKASVEKPVDPQASFTYDGTLHTVEIPENAAYTVYDNTGTDAGSYTLIVRLNNTSDYQWADGTTSNLTYEWRIEKADFDLSGVTFENAEKAYTGSEQSLEVSGLPAGVSVSYSYEGDRVELGQVKVTASFTFTDSKLAQNYNPPADKTALLTIVAAQVEKPVIEGSYTYNGTSQTAQITESERYTVTGNIATNAGEHTVTVALTDKTHYTWTDGSTDDLKLIFTIAKATYDMSGVKFEDLTVTYDGQPHTLTVTGELPEGVEVRYTENTLTNAGQITVTATFTGDAGNYLPIADMEAALTVEKLSHQTELENTEGYEDTVITYDADRTFDAASFAGMLPNLPLTVTIEKAGATVDAIHNAGIYTVTVEVSDPANREGKVVFTVTVNKAEQPEFSLTVSADGVSITAMADAEVEFSLNGQSWQTGGLFEGLTDGQTYTVYAKLAGDENFEDRIQTAQVTTASLAAAREAIAALSGELTASEWRTAILTAKAELDKLNEKEKAVLDVAAYEQALADFNAMREEALAEGETAAELADSMTPVTAAALSLLAILALALKKFF